MCNRIFILLLLFSFNSLAQQNYSKQWGTGGYRQVINFFNTEKPSCVLVGNANISYFNILSGISSICDTNGKFLMMTDGVMLYNAKGDTIKGGGGNINNVCYHKRNNFHNGITNNSIIIPKGNNQFYIFYSAMSEEKCTAYYPPTILDTFNFDEIRYSIVDMNANNGDGAIIKRNEQLIKTISPWVSQASITATRHANGRDWWVVKSSALERRFKYIFLVTPDTIVMHIQDMGNAFNVGFVFDYYGQNNFSMDGSLYAECSGNSPITIYDFDRCSGMFSLKRVIELTPYKDQTFDKYNDWSGVCFSPNNKYLYTCDQHHMYQLNLAEPNDSLATVKVSQFDTSANFPSYSGLQITPTGVLYIGHWNGISKDINAIMQPNEYGLASAFKFDYIRLLSNTNEPPNIPNYGLGALAGSPCDTIRLKPNVWLLYPNPANATIKLKVPITNKLQAVKITVYNMHGQIVLDNNYTLNLNYEITINTTALANGLYYLKATSGGELFGGNFLKE
jgi:Secretion system C-terminal sorting domain